MGLLIILALAIALFTVLFAVQNTAFVTINFFGWVLEERLAIVLLITLALGVVIGLLVSVPALVRRSMKISSRQRQIEDLNWQLRQKDETLDAHQQAIDAVQLRHQELLVALETADPKTGLLKSEWIVQEVNYLMRRMEDRETHPRYGSVCVFFIETSPADPTALDHDQAILMRSLQPIAQQLKRVSTPEIWLHHDGKGRFGCVAAGLDTKTASDYGDALRSSLTDHPLELEDGSTLSITVSIGGAISYPAEHLDGYTLIQQAQAALDHAQRRGRNRLRLVEAKA